MKLSISREQIVAGLQTVQNIVGNRTTLPILSNVLLRAQGGRLELTTTDLDMTISCGVPADVQREGATTLPVKKLFGIVRELSAADVDLDVDDRSACSLRCGSSFFKVHGLSADEFPPSPNFGEERKISATQARMKGMLRRTAFAVSTDETQHVLNGIFFSLKEQRLTMVSTDGRRMALTDEEVEYAQETQGEFIVPTKAVNELTRLLQEKGEMEVRFTENQAAFTLVDEKGGKTLLTSKLVDGNYPNYRQVIPTQSSERIPLGREELLQALRRAEIMTSEKSNSVKLSFSKNNLSITANTPEIGEARESMAINYKGKDLAIAFNPAYLMDPLKALDQDEVFLELSDELSPGVVKINGPFLYVIMPMRMT